MRIWHITLLSSLLALVGCAKVWDKPGANAADFNKDKYDCMQQSQQQVSILAVGKYSGFGQSTQETNATLFGTCMNSRGWTLTDKDAAQSSNSQKKENADAEWTAIEREADEQCLDKKLAAFYAKSPCSSRDMSLSQLTDTSKATPSQKPAIEAVQKNVKNYYTQYIEFHRKYNGARGASYSNYLATVLIPKIDKDYLDLYSNKITWGEFNQRRKNNSEENAKRYAEARGD